MLRQLSRRRDGSSAAAIEHNGSSPAPRRFYARPRRESADHAARSVYKKLDDPGGFEGRQSRPPTARRRALSSATIPGGACRQHLFKRCGRNAAFRSTATFTELFGRRPVPFLRRRGGQGHGELMAAALDSSARPPSASTTTRVGGAKFSTLTALECKARAPHWRARPSVRRPAFAGRVSRARRGHRRLPQGGRCDRRPITAIGGSARRSIASRWRATPKGKLSQDMALFRLTKPMDTENVCAAARRCGRRAFPPGRACAVGADCEDDDLTRAAFAGACGPVGRGNGARCPRLPRRDVRRQSSSSAASRRGVAQAGNARLDGRPARRQGTHDARGRRGRCTFGFATLRLHRSGLHSQQRASDLRATASVAKSAC